MSSPYLLPKYRDFEKEYESVMKCNRCGFCETVCPTYVVSGKETLSPRGRNQAFRQILEGRTPDPSLSSGIFSTCLTCHACTNVCFSEVPVANLMASARAVSAKNSSKLMERFVLKFLLNRRKLLSVLVWLGFLFKRLRLSSLLKKTGILGIMSPELSAAEDLVQEAPLRFGGRGPGKREVPGKYISRAAYFSGCGIHYLYPKASRDMLAILRKSGVEVLTPSHACCGLPAQSAGDLESARRCARENVRRFGELDADVVLVDDDSCCGFMKNYAELIEGARSFSAKVMDLAEFISERKELFKFSEATFQKVTWHDPCQMGNAHKQLGAPRELLKTLPNVEFEEMEESNWCCGGAGAYCLKHPDLAEDVLERKLLNISRTGAGLVLTQASSCLLHINYGIRKKGWEGKISALHLSEFLSSRAFFDFL